jgi:hypothetical protein
MGFSSKIIEGVGHKWHSKFYGSRRALHFVMVNQGCELDFGTHEIGFEFDNNPPHQTLKLPLNSSCL